MTPGCTLGRGALVVVALALVSCTGRHQSAPETSVVSTTSRTVSIESRDVHPTRDAFAAALPTVSDLSWLPPGSIGALDADIADRLVFVGCSAAPHEVESNRANATDVVFHDPGAEGGPIATITYHDAASVDDAAQFMAGMRAFLRCPNQGASPSSTLLPLGNPTVCDDTLALHTTHAQGATIDAWCRVGNLIGRIHIEPRLGLDATVAQGIATIAAVGTHLGALFA